jgi:hypothetical protein
MKKEIGEARQIESTLVHVRGKPLEEAKFIRKLLKTPKEDGEYYTQAEIADLMSITQGYISKRLSLLNLVMPLRHMLSEGKMKASTAYVLSKMPKKKQKEFAKLDYVTLDAAKAAQRKLTFTEEVFDLLETPVDLDGDKLPMTTLRGYLLTMKNLKVRKAAPKVWLDGFDAALEIIKEAVDDGVVVSV